jgi:hypothetical protein
MEIQKGTRHQKVIGQFGEHLICNWLFRSGFEATIVDHTGIDIIAYNPANSRRLGISVKSRTRGRGTERSSVTVFEKEADRSKTLAACTAFGCEPWIAVYVEATDKADLFLLELKDFELIYAAEGKALVRYWRMTPKYEAISSSNSKVMHIRIQFEARNWRFSQADAN